MPISPELLAILVTVIILLAGLLILGGMLQRVGKMLEHIDAVDAVVFLQGRQVRDVVEEIRRSLATSGPHSPER